MESPKKKKKKKKKKWPLDFFFLLSHMKITHIAVGKSDNEDQPPSTEKVKKVKKVRPKKMTFKAVLVTSTKGSPKKPRTPGLLFTGISFQRALLIEIF